MNSSLFLLSIAMATTTLCSAVDLTYKDCGSTAEIVQVFSPDCSAAVCKLKKGNTYNMKITYKPVKAITAMDAKLYGVIAGISVPFPLPIGDGCEASGNACPIAAGTEVTMSEPMKVEPAYPALRLTSRWKLESDGEDVVCVEIPIVIVN